MSCQRRRLCHWGLYVEEQHVCPALIGPEIGHPLSGLSSLPIRLEAADTVIFLDLPAWACLWGIIQRRLRRGEDAGPADTALRAWRRRQYP